MSTTSTSFFDGPRLHARSGITRRGFLAGAAAGALAAPLARGAGRPGDRPNILWITAEDHSPNLGCYGDPLARTPNLDRLAADGVRYTHAYANAPVCAPTRCTLLLGAYASSLGTQHMRSRNPIPDTFRPYPYYLRDQGYYCTNNVKTDYNFAGDDTAPWDESSAQAHYRNRPADRPFFAVFNITDSHEGQMTDALVSERRRDGLLPPTPRLRHEDVVLPPYHPDDPEIREEWVRFYDNMDLVDRRAGEILDELDREGLADDTIVFYFADHGGNLARSKRFLYDTGTRVPLIVRFPEKWRHLAPGEPGGVCDRPVSFVDFAPTLISLVGGAVPDAMQGRAFLGSQARPPAPCVYLFRNRMDERYDFSRAVTDSRYRYIRNYMPHRPPGQHLNFPYGVQRSWPAWERAWREGRCNEVQSAFWRPKPPEELYDTQADPWEVRNLADDPAHAQRLADLRQALRCMVLDTRDTGFIPESLFPSPATGQTVHAFAQGPGYRIEEVLDLADKASRRDPAVLPDLQAGLGHADPVIRYWGATGCAVSGEGARPAKAALLGLLDDAAPAVRSAAAEALAHLGERPRAVETLAATVVSEGDFAALEAFNALDLLGARDALPVETLRAIRDDEDRYLYSSRIARYWLEGAGES